MELLARIPITLDQKEIEMVGKRWLSFLTQGEWVETRKGKDVLMHEVATSHRFDTEVDYQDPVRIKIVKAVQEFRTALKEYEEAFAKDGRK